MNISRARTITKTPLQLHIYRRELTTTITLILFTGANSNNCVIETYITQNKIHLTAVKLDFEGRKMSAVQALRLPTSAL